MGTSDPGGVIMSATKTKLTVYLLKEEIQEAKEAIDETNDFIIFRQIDDFHVFIKHKSEYTPSWVDSFFNGKINELKQLSAPCVVAIKRITVSGGPRFFALTFGNVRSLLKQDSIEERFGLKIALNSIEREGIRKISKSCIGTNQKRTEEQMPRGCSIDEFGFDIERDLIKNVSGRVNNELLEKSMVSGSDSFAVSVGRSIDDIDDFLIHLYDYYKRDDYKKAFAWLDNIAAIKNDSELKKQLDSILLQEIKTEHYEAVWMAVPEVLRWEEIDHFEVQGDKEHYDDIRIDAVIHSFKHEIESIENFKQKTIKAIRKDRGEEIYQSWTAYKCLIGEITYEDHQYVLSDGKWYEISRDYAQDVSDQYDQIELFEEGFPPFSEGANEDDYNGLLSKSIHEAVETHKVKLSLKRGQGNVIEPCDIYQNNTFIHIKRNGGSAVLSHLFNQGLVSAKLLLDRKLYEQFKTKAKEQIDDQSSSCNVSDSYVAKDTTIVFGIINHYASPRPKIPFFSKVSLCTIARELMGYGFHLKLKNIETQKTK